MSTSSYQNLKSVLLVDDDPAILTTLKIFFDLINLPTVTANNGAEAKILLKSDAIDLLVTDLQMPEVDGVELLEWCREESIHIPVIFMSANANLVHREQVALSDCCATLMMKPLNIDSLASAIGAADARSHHRDCIHERSSPVPSY